MTLPGLHASLVADVLLDCVADAKVGHCLRVDDIEAAFAFELSEAAADQAHDSVAVRVLSNENLPNSVSIEEAVGIRNDKEHVFVLLVPSKFAREASSLDNSFERVALVELLRRTAALLEAKVAEARPDIPLLALKQASGKRFDVENWIQFLTAMKSDPNAIFGDEIHKLGLFPDSGSADEVAERLRRNAVFVGTLADPTKAAIGVRERLQQAGLGPGAMFERVATGLVRYAGRLHDPQSWVRAFSEEADLKFGDLGLSGGEVDADLESVEVLSFRTPEGRLIRTSKLKELDDDTLVCEVSDTSVGEVKVTWRTIPSAASGVDRWLLEVLPPEDLRNGQDPLAEMQVAGSRRSANVKLDVTTDDLVGGSLFVIKVTALGEGGNAIQLQHDVDGQDESDAFEVRFLDEPTERETRASSATSVAEARLRSIVNGAQSLDEDMTSWDVAGQVFGIRIGRARTSLVRVPGLIVDLQRKVLQNSLIFGFHVESAYGAAVSAADCVPLEAELPPAFSKKRRAILKMLADGGQRDVPEVFPWDIASRELVQDYVASYKRALDAADEDTRQLLQSIDTLSVSAGSGTGIERALVVLPLHPLRLGWIAAFHQLTSEWAELLLNEYPSAAARKLSMDIEKLARVIPTNLPFSISSHEGDPFVYFDELSFGTGLMLPLGCSSQEASAAIICGALGLNRDSAVVSAAAAMVHGRIGEFREAHPTVRAMKIAAINPGDAEVLARAIEPLVEPSVDESEPLPRIEIVAYGPVLNFASPLRPLSAIQERLNDSEISSDQNHLIPPLGVALRPSSRLVEDEESFHLTLAQGIADESIGEVSDDGLARFASFHDLLTPLITVRDDVEGQLGWLVSPALTPRANLLASGIVEAHRAHQMAVGSILGQAGPLAVRIAIPPEDLQALRISHEQSDWVLTLDRFVGLDLYEDGVSAGLGVDSYILDYAPDFIDGLSHKLTVTTSHRTEVSGILMRAMDELGMDALEGSISRVLVDLMAVSGRLILRLQSSESFARESVSLAALVAHLKARGELEETIIVPVDSHHEIFGRSAQGNETGRRCDMLLVRVTQRKLRIECVEVKSRKHAKLPAALADDIVDQLEETSRLLENRFFASDPARVDASLQRAHLAGLLHYYADRAAMSGVLGTDRLPETHRNIDRLVEGGMEVEISMKGYVISLAGAAGIPATWRGVPIRVLTAADLGAAGFSTKFDENSFPLEGDEKLSDPSISAHVDSPEDDSPSPPISEDGPSLDSSPRSHEPVISDSEAARSDDVDVPADTADERPIISESTSSRGALDGIVEVLLGQDAVGADVVWRLSTKGSPHAFVLGIPGQGKSVTTRRVIRSFQSQGLPSLVFDFHGDMATDPPADAEILDAAMGLPFSPFDQVPDVPARVNMASWEIAEIVAFVSGLGEIQRNNVYKAIQASYAAVAPGALPTLSQFADELELVEEVARGKHARDRIRPLTDFGLFDESATRRFEPKESGMVVDLSSLPLEEVQLAAGAFLLRRIYKDMFTWEQDGSLKLAIVLDEAHRLAKDVTLPKLMKEGRKYGLAVVVASQGVADFHKDVLGNAGTKIVFRTNHPGSKTVAGFLRSRTGQDLSQEIEKLGVGQAYVSTPDMPQARKVHMLE